MDNIRNIMTMAFLAVALAAGAQNEDLFRNPAMQSFRHKSSRNEVALGYDYRHATEPMRLEQGDGHSRAFAHVDAYLHKGKATLWGEADYSNGSTRNIQYCETSDFELLYPYLMADTVGGKSKQEHYHFLGGFSYPLGERWHIGAEGSYTALMEYRTRDPRPKNLTGDLKAKVAASYRIDKAQGGYVLGLALGGRRYKQTNELKLYNEVGVPTIYHLTGLGLDYYRFRGQNTSTYYKGYGVSMMLDLSREDQRGWFAHAEYGYQDIDKIISSLNELPMANIREYREHASVGYRLGTMQDVLGFALMEQWTRRRGRENIFSTAQDNVYPQIATAAPYLANRVMGGVEMLYRHRSAKGSILEARWNLRYTDENQSHNTEGREMASHAWGMGASVDGRWSLGNLRLLANLAAGYEWSGGNRWEMGDAGQDDKLMLPVVYYYEYLSHDRQNMAATVEAGYAKDKRFTPFVRLGWQYAAYRQGAHQNELVAAMGVKF